MRELRAEEAERLEQSVRSDYEPFLSFARLSGQRFKECLMLQWSEVDWTERLIRTTGKAVAWFHPDHADYRIHSVAHARPSSRACLHLYRPADA